MMPARYLPLAVHCILCGLRFIIIVFVQRKTPQLQTSCVADVSVPNSLPNLIGAQTNHRFQYRIKSGCYTEM